MDMLDKVKMLKTKATAGRGGNLITIGKLTLMALTWAVVTAYVPARAQAAECLAESVWQENLQGHSVTFATFGGAAVTGGEIASDEELAPTATGVTRGGVNVRGGPGTDFALVGGLDAGAEVTILGSTTAKDWYQIAFGNEAVAWVFAELIIVSGNLPSTLPVVNTNEEAALNLPVRAFELSAADQATDCLGGLLLQVPAGSGQVRLMINDVALLADGTVYVRALDEGGLTLYSLTETAYLSGGGNTYEVPAGYASATTTGSIERYPYAAAAALPLDALPENTQIAPPDGIGFGISPDGACTLLAADGTASGAASAPAGQTLLVSSAVRSNPDALTLFARSAQRNLFLDGAVVELWSVRGPFSDDTDAELQYAVWWWVLPDLAPGSYTLTLETNNTGSNLDGEVSCTLVVE